MSVFFYGADLNHEMICVLIVTMLVCEPAEAERQVKPRQSHCIENGFMKHIAKRKVISHFYFDLASIMGRPSANASEREALSLHCKFRPSAIAGTSLKLFLEPNLS